MTITGTDLQYFSRLATYILGVDKTEFKNVKNHMRHFLEIFKHCESAYCALVNDSVYSTTFEKLHYKLQTLLLVRSKE